MKTTGPFAAAITLPNEDSDNLVPLGLLLHFSPIPWEAELGFDRCRLFVTNGCRGSVVCPIPCFGVFWRQRLAT